MKRLEHMGYIMVGCILCVVMPAFLHAEFTLARVLERGLYICTCIQDLAACSTINPSECNCENLPFSMPVTFKLLTVWYTSPINVARLLNNSEIRHLALAKCNSTRSMSPSFDYFTVKRLERLSILYPGQKYDIVLGKDMGSPYHEQPRIAVIHTAVLAGKVGLKAYTIETKVDGNGMIPFPSVFMDVDELSGLSNIFVTFLY